MFSKFWNRHPFFYQIRFWILLRKVSKEELSECHYNRYNKEEEIPRLFWKISSEIFKDLDQPNGDFEKALNIAHWLLANVSGGRGLGAHSEKTMTLMLQGGYGICSDFCQVFNNLCVVNQVKVREWGLNNLSFSSDGHSFNEIYAEEWNKWILLDVANGIYFIDPNRQDPTPLSVLEVFYFSLHNIPKKMCFLSTKENPNLDKMNDFYFSDSYRPFLIDEYRNRFFDFLLQKLSFLPIPFIHGISIILFSSYKFKKVEL